MAVIKNFSAAVVVVMALAVPRQSNAAEALITNQNGDSLSFLDLSEMKVSTEIKIGGKPAGIALSADKSKAYQKGEG